MDGFFSNETLLNAPAIKRAAYSDRMAWLMAQLAGLVYEPLPGEEPDKERIDQVFSAIERNEDRDVIEKLIQAAMQKNAASNSAIPENLEIGKFKLVEPFSQGGTEAMLVKHHADERSDGILVLVFRGTQPNIIDVVTDLKADLVSAPGGGRVHHGFLEAYKKVEPQIKAACEKHARLPLYITGHSLGGALAMLATRYIGDDSTGATYTFGCPRAADDEFYKNIKTPIYRIVNAADAVPRVPFGYGMSILLSAIRLIPVNFTRSVSEWVRRNFAGYTHHGDLIFLSDAANTPDIQGIPFKELIIKRSPNIFWRASMVVKRWVMTRGEAGVSDHRMTEYSQKLAAWALRRNR
ncbi:MAG: lipase family protein [Motiliproteus sp.]